MKGSLDVVRERFVNDLVGGPVGEEMLHSWSRLLRLPSAEPDIQLTVFGYDRFLSAGKDAMDRVMLDNGFLNRLRSDYPISLMPMPGQDGADEVTVVHLNPQPSELRKTGEAACLYPACRPGAIQRQRDDRGGPHVQAMGGCAGCI